MNWVVYYRWTIEDSSCTEKVQSQHEALRSDNSVEHQWSQRRRQRSELCLLETTETCRRWGSARGRRLRRIEYRSQALELFYHTATYKQNVSVSASSTSIHQQSIASPVCFSSGIGQGFVHCWLAGSEEGWLPVAQQTGHRPARPWGWSAPACSCRVTAVR